MPATEGHGIGRLADGRPEEPQFAYRASICCLAGHSTFDRALARVLIYSELTCNRNYFWLDGFPLLAQYGGEYTGRWRNRPMCARSSSMPAVRREVPVGGGWDTWHQRKYSGTMSRDRFSTIWIFFHFTTGSAGIYLEPVAGSERTDPAESLKS